MSGGRISDAGAATRVERDPARPGWLCIVVERSKTRRLWLAEDEAAQVYAQLGKQLPTVEIRRV